MFLGNMERLLIILVFGLCVGLFLSTNGQNIRDKIKERREQRKNVNDGEEDNQETSHQTTDMPEENLDKQEMTEHDKDEQNSMNDQQNEQNGMPSGKRQKEEDQMMNAEEKKQNGKTSDVDSGNRRQNMDQESQNRNANSDDEQEDDQEQGDPITDSDDRGRGNSPPAKHEIEDNPLRQKTFKGKLFDADGKVSRAFRNRLLKFVRQTLEEIEANYSTVLNLYKLFKDVKPETLEIFLTMFANRAVKLFDKLKEHPDSLTEQELTQISLDIIAAFEEEALKSIVEKLPKKLKEFLCKCLQKDQTNYNNTRKIEKCVDCLENLPMKDEPLAKKLARAIAENRIGHVVELTEDQYQAAFNGSYFTGLDSKLLKGCPPSILKNNFQKLKHIKDKNLRDYLIKKASSREGTPAKLTKEDMEKRKGLGDSIIPDDIKRMDPEDVRASLGIWKNEPQMKPSTKIAIRKVILKNKQLESLSQREVAESLPFFSSKLVKRLDVETLASAVENEGLGNLKLNKRQKKITLKQLRKSSKFSKPETMDIGSVKLLGELFEAFTDVMIDNLKSINFADLMKESFFENKTFESSASRAMIKKCKAAKNKQLTEYNEEDVKALGPLVNEMSMEDIGNLDKEVVAAIVTKRLESNPKEVKSMASHTRSLFIKKIEASTGGLQMNVQKLHALCENIPVRKLKDLRKKPSMDYTGNTKWNITCSKKNSRYFYNKIANEIGEPSEANSNYTKRRIQNYGTCLCGMPVSHMKNLTLTSLDGLNQLAKIDILSAKKRQTIKDLFKKKLGLDDTDTTIEISDDEIDESVEILKHFSSEEVKRFAREKRLAIFDAISASGVSNGGPKQLDELYALHQETEGTESGPITSDNVTRLQGLLCGLPEPAIPSIEKEAMSDMMEIIHEQCFTMRKGKREAFAKEAVKKFEINLGSEDIATWKTEELLQINSSIIYLPDADLDKVPNAVWEDIGPTILSAIEEIDVKIKQMNRNERKHQFPKAERKYYKERKRSFATRVKTATKEVFSRRRKRSTPALTCTDMQLLGSGVTSMTTHDIEAMNDLEFLECANFLGSYSTWTHQQVQSLLLVSSREGTFSTSDSWTDDHVLKAGKIAQGLSSTQISKLSQLSIDAMYSIGRHEGWSETQRSAGFTRWLILNKGALPNNITATELLSLGHFACGASTNEIGQMKPTIYSHAASEVGELTSCSYDQLIAYAALAKKAFGEVTTWDTSVIATVGGIIGGLSAQELGSLSTDQVEAILPDSIELMPPSTFVGFTPEHLASFSIAQGQSTTAAQQAGLTQAKINALAKAGATLYSSGSVVKISTLLLTVVLTITHTFF